MVRIPRVHRVGIDLDTKNRLKLLKTYFNAKRFSKAVICYTTRNGYHVHIGIKNRSSQDNMHIRRILGDCLMRLEIDEARLRIGCDDNIETLFHWKRTPDGEVSREELMNPLSEPFWGDMVYLSQK